MLNDHLNSKMVNCLFISSILLDFVVVVIKNFFLYVIAINLLSPRLHIVPSAG